MNARTDAALLQNDNNMSYHLNNSHLDALCHYRLPRDGKQLVFNGHPQDLDEKFKRWTLKDLPILPDDFDGSARPGILKVVISERNNGDRFKLLKKLLAREDVGTVVNACDAGREGELIFRNAVVLEDTRDTRLNRCVRVIVAVCFRLQIGRDERLVVASTHPLIDVEV